MSYCGSINQKQTHFIFDFSLLKPDLLASLSLSLSLSLSHNSPIVHKMVSTFTDKRKGGADGADRHPLQLGFIDLCCGWSWVEFSFLVSPIYSIDGCGKAGEERKKKNPTERREKIVFINKNNI
jgi:hypothetical protein